MSKPRYDEEKNETRHGATSEESCTNMEDKYGWKLKNVEETGNSMLSVDCIFDGYCEFPPSPMDLSQGDCLKERQEDA
jgi:hypothetical protein